jgi:hypothetical protein
VFWFQFTASFSQFRAEQVKGKNLQAGHQEKKTKIRTPLTQQSPSSADFHLTAR